MAATRRQALGEPVNKEGEDDFDTFGGYLFSTLTQVIGTRAVNEIRGGASLFNYTRDSAVVIVAQRVSTIMSADDILVLEDGVIVGHGTHEELIESSETYAEIVQSQIGEKDAA